MRVIKFRAWDNRQKEMYANALPCLTEGIAEVETAEEGMPAMTIISNAILMQFTGLRDKNGKEIYEGDLLKINQGSKDAINSVYEVVFDFGAFQMKRFPKPKEDYQLTAFITYAVQCSKFLLGIQDKNAVQGYLEVIGNIYEHPQLLTHETIAQ